MKNYKTFRQKQEKIHKKLFSVAKEKLLTRLLKEK